MSGLGISELFSFVVATLMACLIPVLTLAAMLSRHHGSWTPHYQKEEHLATAGEGAFRTTEVKTSQWKVVGNGLPVLVAIAAFTSFFVAQMVIPAAPAALLGLVIGLDGGGSNQKTWLVLYALSFFPGAVCAIQTGRAGLALLRGNRFAATSAIRWNSILNLGYNMLFAGGVAFAKFSGIRDLEFAYVGLAYGAVVVTHTIFVHAVFSGYQERFVAS